MNDENASLAQSIILGHIAGVHGIKGWIKVHSYTEPREAIFDYQPWMLGEAGTATEVLEGGTSGKFLLARLKSVETRDAAEALRGKEIRVGREMLPELEKNKFYWADLVGLPVVNKDGVELGRIREMLATGANDVMVVESDVEGGKERLIPFVMGMYVLEVDLAQDGSKGGVKVDWDPDF